MKRALFCSILLLSACAAPHDGKPPELPLPELDCSCGELEADLFGCPARACDGGQGDASNPSCACGSGEQGALWLADGTRLTDGVLENDGLTLELESADGETRTLPYTELAPRSAYRAAAARTARGDAAGQLALAQVAEGLGLFALAREHLALSERAAPKSAGRLGLERAELEQAAAAALLAAAETDLAEGRAREAERRFAAIITTHPGSPQTRAAADALDLAADEAIAARAARREAWTLEPSEALALLDLQLEQVHAYAQRGVMAGTSPLKAVVNLEAAIQLGDELGEPLGQLIEGAPPDSLLAARAQELETERLDRLVTSCELLADLAMRLGAHETARLAALRARDLAPASDEARRLHARVATSGPISDSSR